jgi:hypothetical protein
MRIERQLATLLQVICLLFVSDFFSFSFSSAGESAAGNAQQIAASLSKSLLLYWYKRTCFTGSKEQILTRLICCRASLQRA